MKLSTYRLGLIPILAIPIAWYLLIAWAPSYVRTFLAGLAGGLVTYTVWGWWRARYMRQLQDAALGTPLSPAETRIYLDGIVRRDVQ